MRTIRALFVATLLAGAVPAQTTSLPGQVAFLALHVSPAGTIVDSSGNTVVLRGLNRSGTGSGNADATATDQDYAAQNQLLSMNLVRIFVNAAWWNSNVQVPIANMGYQAYIDTLIQRAKKYGNYVLILKDEQFSTPPCGADGLNCTTPQSGDLSCPNPPGCAADTTGNFTDIAFTFWAGFAKKYAADPAVLYDTWEDMHGIDNNTWSDDQNALIAAIRDENPQALIFVEDIDADQTFESIVKGTLQDLAWPNIVWNFHLYNGSSGSCREPQSRRAVNWPQNIDPLVIYAQQQGHAVGIMEWGGCNDDEPFHTSVTLYAQIHSLALAYFDNTNLIAQSGGTYQLTPIGTKIAQAYTALASGTVISGNQLTPLAHAADLIGFKTTAILTNAGSTPALYGLQFNDASGNPPAPDVGLELGSQEGTIPAGGSATIRTAGIGSYVGWAELTAPASVGGSVIYSQQVPQLPTIQEGTTTLNANGAQHFFVPFDNTQGAATSMALTSPTGFATIRLTIRYSDGSVEGPAYGPLAQGQHDSFELRVKFPNTSNRSGVAEFASNRPLYVVVFRFNPTGSFTALDVVQAGATSSSITRTLSHTADLTFPNSGYFKTTVLLTNTDVNPAPYTLQFNNAQGSPATVGLDVGSAPISGTIPPSGSATIRTAGTGSYVGSAQLVNTPASVGGSVIYSQKTQLPTIQEGTATIVSAGSQHFFVPFDNTLGAATSMALTNSGATPANVTVTLRYTDGGPPDSPAYGPLAAGQHDSFELRTKFSTTANRSGVAEFKSSVPLYVVAFRFNPTGAFTAFGTVASQ
jgi:hypothetical protein